MTRVVTNGALFGHIIMFIAKMVLRSKSQSNLTIYYLEGLMNYRIIRFRCKVLICV